MWNNTFGFSSDFGNNWSPGESERESVWVVFVCVYVRYYEHLLSAYVTARGRCRNVGSTVECERERERDSGKEERERECVCVS